MSSYRETLGKQAAGVLEPGECFVAAAMCLPRGGSKRRAVGGLLGALGVLAAGETRASSDHAVCGQPLPTNLAVGVTDRRLLIFKLTEVTDKAKKLIRSIPFTHIVGVSVDVGWSFGMTVVHIEIGFTDGSTVSLEAARPNTNDGQQFAHTLAAATSTLGASPSTM